MVLRGRSAKTAPSLDAHSLLPVRGSSPAQLAELERQAKKRAYRREVQARSEQKKVGHAYLVEPFGAPHVLEQRRGAEPKARPTRKGRLAAAASFFGYRRERRTAIVPDSLLTCPSPARQHGTTKQPRAGAQPANTISPAAAQVPRPWRLLAPETPAESTASSGPSRTSSDAMERWHTAACRRFGDEGLTSSDTCSRRLAKWLALCCNTQQGAFVSLADLEVACRSIGIEHEAFEVASGLWTELASRDRLPIARLLSSSEKMHHENSSEGNDAGATESPSQQLAEDLLALTGDGGDEEPEPLSQHCEQAAAADVDAFLTLAKLQRYAHPTAFSAKLCSSIGGATERVSPGLLLDGGASGVQVRDSHQQPVR